MRDGVTSQSIDNTSSEAHEDATTHADEPPPEKSESVRDRASWWLPDPSEIAG